MTATNKPMTGAQLDELMAVAMRMQYDSEKMGERSVSMFAYAVQVAVLEIRETRCKYEELQSQNADLAVQLANAESKCREMAAENGEAKKIISECRGYFIAGVMNRIRPTNEGYLHMICDTFAAETPATDAFLAEVRASELDSLAGVAETMLVKFANQNASEIPEAKGWEMIRRQASQRAAKIRQEAAQ
ncbi:hypothetical protein [Citrobacter sp. Cb004]|uniref:hypothetical protein n=1 Tax=Citrobacter sp. Cb004 TaxID=2985006 RepID=UPI002575466D|nr:hypothetical protein [Citrobacter sp. Cb004]MDM3357450.1 hypothetical protein [Citrobacter sp. Cb004]